MWPALERLRLPAVQSLTSHRALRSRQSSHYHSPDRPAMRPSSLSVGCRQEASRRLAVGIGFFWKACLTRVGFIILSYLFSFNCAACGILFLSRSQVSRPLQHMSHPHALRALAHSPRSRTASVVDLSKTSGHRSHYCCHVTHV